MSHDLGIGITQTSRVAALADWNNDNTVDLLAIGLDNRTFEVLLWSSANHSFYAADQLHMSPHLEVGEVLAGIVAADFNRDGRVDAVITTSAGWTYIVLGGKSTMAATPVTGLNSLSDPQSLNALNVYGKCANVDLLGLSSTTGLTVFANQEPVTHECAFGSTDAPIFKAEKTFSAVDGYDGFSSSSDFNGDCQADIVLRKLVTEGSSTRYQYELYLAGGLDTSPAGGSSSGPTTFTVPSFTGRPTFADYDGDGVVDVALPSCNTPTAVGTCAAFDALLVLLSKMPEGEKVCSVTSCCASHGFNFPSVTEIQNTTEHVKLLNLTSVCQLSSSSSLGPVAGVTLRALDWNNDHFNDLLFASDLGPILLETVTGLHFSCVKPVEQSGATAIPIGRTTDPFFYDLLDDGRVDILITTPGMGLFALWNNLDTAENYFFTATTLNGVKSPNAPFPSWGGVQIGAVHRFQWQDIEQSLKTGGSTQLSTSQYAALEFPRMHFGLSKTFGYIQGYSTGMRIADVDKPYNSWSVYLVPNSQVICPAYALTNPADWHIELFFSPIRYMTLVVISLVVALAVIGIPILVLKYREWKQDTAARGYLAS